MAQEVALIRSGTRAGRNTAGTTAAARRRRLNSHLLRRGTNERLPSRPRFLGRLQFCLVCLISGPWMRWIVSDPLQPCDE
jgi:hypothetical protein